MKENQYTEEEILDNNDPSPHFEEFLQILGEKVKLKGKVWSEKTDSKVDAYISVNFSYIFTNFVSQELHIFIAF